MLLDELWIEVFHFLPMKNYFSIVPLINTHWYTQFFRKFESHFSDFYFSRTFVQPFAFPNNPQIPKSILTYSKLKNLVKDPWIHRISVVKIANEKFKLSLRQYVPFQNVEFAFFQLHPLLHTILESNSSAVDSISHQLHQLAAMCGVMESQHKNGFDFPVFHVMEVAEVQSNQLEWVVMGHRAKWNPKTPQHFKTCSHYQLFSHILPKSNQSATTVFNAQYGVLYPVWLHRMKRFEEYIPSTATKTSNSNETNAFNLLRWTKYPVFGVGNVSEEVLQNLEEVIIKQSTQMIRWTLPNQSQSGFQFQKLDEVTKKSSLQSNWCDYFTKGIHYGVHGCCTFWNPTYQILIVMKLAALPEV